MAFLVFAFELVTPIIGWYTVDFFVRVLGAVFDLGIDQVFFVFIFFVFELSFLAGVRLQLRSSGSLELGFAVFLIRVNHTFTLLSRVTMSSCTSLVVRNC